MEDFTANASAASWVCLFLQTITVTQRKGNGIFVLELKLSLLKRNFTCTCGLEGDTF